MSASNLNASAIADEKYWTILGTSGEDNYGTGGVHEESFAGVFIAPTAEEAESLAREYNGYEFNGWLEIHEVVPGAVEGITICVPLEELQELYEPTDAPDLIP